MRGRASWSGRRRDTRASGRRGVKLGRPSKHPALVEVALQRVAAGESMRAVARDLGIGATTLRRVRAVAARS